jgi:hypothetical protein
MHYSTSSGVHKFSKNICHLKIVGAQRMIWSTGFMHPSTSYNHSNFSSHTVYITMSAHMSAINVRYKPWWRPVMKTCGRTQCIIRECLWCRNNKHGIMALCATCDILKNKGYIYNTCTEDALKIYNQDAVFYISPAQPEWTRNKVFGMMHVCGLCVGICTCACMCMKEMFFVRCVYMYERNFAVRLFMHTRVGEK